MCIVKVNKGVALTLYSKDELSRNRVEGSRCKVINDYLIFQEKGEQPRVLDLDYFASIAIDASLQERSVDRSIEYCLAELAKGTNPAMLDAYFMSGELVCIVTASKDVLVTKSDGSDYVVTSWDLFQELIDYFFKLTNLEVVEPRDRLTTRSQSTGKLLTKEKEFSTYLYSDVIVKISTEGAACMGIRNLGNYREELDNMPIVTRDMVELYVAQEKPVSILPVGDVTKVDYGNVDVDSVTIFLVDNEYFVILNKSDRKRLELPAKDLMDIYGDAYVRTGYTCPENRRVLKETYLETEDARKTEAIVAVANLINKT